MKDYLSRGMAEMMNLDKVEKLIVDFVATINEANEEVMKMIIK